MKKRYTAAAVLYYPLVLLLYTIFFKLASLLLNSAGGSISLGGAMAATYALLFLAVPVMTAAVVRFSLLSWIVDPFAAAEIPLFLYGMMVFGRANRTGSLLSSVMLVNRDLCDDGGEGWLFLAGLFLFGLIASFSPARLRGESISFCLLDRLTKKQRGCCT